MINLNYVFLIVLAIVLSYVAFPRQTTNIWIGISKNKEYVVCHMKRQSSQFIDKYLVVPTADKVTNVGNKGAYTLENRFAAYTDIRGRLNFILEEGNSIPKHFKDEEEKKNWMYPAFPKRVIFEFKAISTDDILFQAKAVHNALNNNVAEYLFSKKKDIYYIVLIAMVAIMFVVLVYSVWTLNRTNAVLEYFAANPPNGVVVGN